ncbi:LOW QUALITY PROTEIN: probable galactinol--sucrose galactosyltransferase 2 [Dioscorea cayenensis subsp. rotundata]|uniref:galactinol--sucrose galactosyltransferase n=1 Tax=Dioscorea cayennensis subsp. rotundata TaxID=55577 RepID=A0AB40CNH3_DIOCR|nr:LOW QUALITY PROTEIN: probable galactinol--sucrose galactosyltransferase 2 [Dioscorea cayenensis subsp. rotundata]
MIHSPLIPLHFNPNFSPFLKPNTNKLFSNAHQKFPRPWRHSLSLVSALKPLVKDGVLKINDKEALKNVPDNVLVSKPVDGSAVFLGAVSDEMSSRHVFKLGVLEDCRLLCLFRHKIWWMIPRMGNSGSDIPVETQMLLVESKEEKESRNGSSDYILFLPVLDGPFRSSLQGNSFNELEFCIESGDPAVQASQFNESVFVNSGSNPFELVNESIKKLRSYKGTFSLREDKSIPGMLDWFGWCTWDAFYTEVSPRGIEDGLKSLYEGGIPVKFLIIDDGWQDITNEFQKEGEPHIEGSQYGARLVSIKENSKFRGLKDFITKIKKTYGLKYIYAWHALMGYWGGLEPNAPGTKKYNPRLVIPNQSPGNLAHIRDFSMDDGMQIYGVSMIDPEKIFEFYDDLHSYLVSQNVDGVKVDVQNILETIAAGYGGRASLTQWFHQNLERSIAKNFQDNSIICCMCQSNDSIYSAKVSAVARASDDYMPRDASSQTLHIATVAFNSLFLGEIMVPDWDMFYSRHYAAEFHAAARALGGCGVYISDKPGEHDFSLLKKLVLPDGSVLRAKYPGRPTRDCLFSDPVMDGKSLLKIWNLNSLSGVIGIFNCQGAGTWPGMVSNEDGNSSDRILTGSVRPVDIEFLENIAGKDWTGDSAVYSFNAGSLSRLSKNETVTVSLKVLECELFTISPIKKYSSNIEFAPIGLIKMYNSGGAVESIDSDLRDNNSIIQLSIRGRGSGLFGAFSSAKPKSCKLNSKEQEFSFIVDDNFLTFMIPPSDSSWKIDVSF